MANYNQQQSNTTASGTNVQHVKQQNAQSAQAQQSAAGQQQYGMSTAQTDVQHVKQQNAQAAQNKQQASTQSPQQ